MKMLARIVLISLLFGIPASAQKSNFTVEQVMSSPFPSGLTSAMQSPRVAWVFYNKGESNVWIADAPNFEARQVTHYQGDDGMPIASLRLTPDGRTIVYARGSEVSSAGHVANPASQLKEPKQQVWAADVENGTPRLLGEMGCDEEGCEDIQISPDGKWAVWSGPKHHLWLAPVAGGQPAKQLTELRGDEAEPQWSPDGQHIALVSDRRDHSLIIVYDLSPERVHYIAPTSERDLHPHWSLDGKQLVFVRTGGAQNHLALIPLRPRPWGIWIADAGNGQGHEVWHSGTDMNSSLPPFEDSTFNFLAGNRILFNSEQDGRNHLYSISASGGQPTLLTPGDFDVEDVSLSPDKTTVLYSSNQDDVDRRHLWRVSANGGPPQALSRGKTMEWAPVTASDGKSITCLGSTATSPAMPYRLTSNGREMIAANVLPTDFPSAQLVEPQQVTFKSDDGLTIHGQLFVPRNHAPRAPALIFTHGGPPRQMMLGFHYMRYYHNAYAENQYLASLGYVVLSVNYRLGIMYGRAFRQPPNSGWRGGAEYKDVQAGAKYLLSLPYVDPKRIGLWGGSYGGYLTAMGLARNSDIFAAGVDFHGVHDWSARLLRRSDETESEIPDYKEAVQLAFNSSPVSTISQWKSPVLLLHADDDRNVNFRQTTDLVQRLREQHVEFEEIIFPDEIHDFLMWRTWVEGYKATADFFNRRFMGTGK
jgi:dipeptidyl aminopeptidase/acylaminoacyl peptidase